MPGEREPADAERAAPSLAKLMQFSRAEAPNVTTEDGTLPGPAGDYRLSPLCADRLRTHAARFRVLSRRRLVAGSIETHDHIAAALAQATGCRLVSIGYRLAPEHKFPAAVDNAIAATEFVARDAASLGIDADRLVVGGDSAGGTLAAVVCQHAEHHSPARSFSRNA